MEFIHETDVTSFTMSKNVTVFNDLKTGLVIMRIARFCIINKGFTFDKT